MFEITRNTREVNGHYVPTWKRSIDVLNALEVEVGTTGHCKGNAEREGKTYFRIADLFCTNIQVETICDDDGQIQEFVVKLGGDSELRTFVEALKFAAATLENEGEKNGQQ